MTVAGLLLAGGASRRFGSEKAIAPFGEGLLMDGPLQALAGGCEVVAVSAQASSAAAAIAETCGYRVLADAPEAAAGPLAGILSGLRWADALGAERLAVAPCDAPTLTAEMVRRLIGGAGGGRASCALSDRGLEPLIAVWPVERGLAEVERAIGEGVHPPVRTVLETLEVVRVQGFDGVNVNMREDLPATAGAAPDEPDHARLFAFEDDFVRTLRCIPMCVRFKLDRTGIKLSLRQWSRFTLDDRQTLRRAPCATSLEVEAYRHLLVDLVARRAGEDATSLLETPLDTWRKPTPPQAVTEMASARRAGAVTADAWRSLSDLQRYALVKLTRDKHENANFAPALKEFGVGATEAALGR